MRMFLKIAGIIIGVVILVAGIIAGYAYYRIKTIKDTHDLQARVNKMCNTYLEKDKGVGLFVGIIQDGRIYAQGFGLADKDRGDVPDSNTIFEIGSISKVFTAELAQLLSEQNQLNWQDNIRQYLPAEAMPATDDSTTLLHLVTHTSGLPRLPESWYPKIMANECDPYSNLDMTDLYSTIKTGKKNKPSMGQYEYSNLGMGLLGHILEWRTGKTYEALLQENICGPLRMSHTSTSMSDSLVYARGYDEKGEATCYWKFSIIPGAGAIKSNGADMLRFLEANMNNTAVPGKSFARTHQKVTDIPGGAIAHGWHIDKFSGGLFGLGEIIWHNGGTGGFSSYIGFLPGKKTGVVVLSNRSDAGLDELAISILVKAGKISLK